MTHLSLPSLILSANPTPPAITYHRNLATTYKHHFKKKKKNTHTHTHTHHSNHIKNPINDPQITHCKTIKSHQIKPGKSQQANRNFQKM